MEKLKCDYCNKDHQQPKDFIETMGNFCSVNCADKDYRAKQFQSEIERENPDFDYLSELDYVPY